MPVLRGARLLAEVLGGKLTCDAYHVTAPNPERIGRSTGDTRCVGNGAKSNRNVSAWSTRHGTGTPLNDSTEALAPSHRLWRCSIQAKGYQHQEHGGTRLWLGRRPVHHCGGMHAPTWLGATDHQLHP